MASSMQGQAKTSDNQRDALAPSQATVNISLVSHTNVGKTSLARTLLMQDVGEVKDQAHVTQQAQSYALVQSSHAQLLLWDTPGFGDSVKLAKRLANDSNPLGWLLTQVWDRLTDHGFWMSQRAITHVFDKTDVVLYLVNASESPASAVYLAAEMKVLGLLQKPVVVLLNQLGAPSGSAAIQTDVDIWQHYFAADPLVKQVLPFDAFSRCWVQEFALRDALHHALPQSKHAAFDALAQLWHQGNVQRWRQAMQMLDDLIAHMAWDVQAVMGQNWKTRLQSVSQAVGNRLGMPEGKTNPADKAMRDLTERLQHAIQRNQQQLIALHGLKGHSAQHVLAQVMQYVDLQKSVSKSKSALWGGVLTGALTGFKADVLSGGLSMGAGALVGVVVGAMGGAGLAHGVNKLRGVEQDSVRWGDEMMTQTLQASLLTYLAVAHFGRGRGDWVNEQEPQIWHDAVQAVLTQYQMPWQDLLHKRQNALQAMVDARADDDQASTQVALHLKTQWQLQLRDLMCELSQALLLRLYPATKAWYASNGSGGASSAKV